MDSGGSLWRTPAKPRHERCRCEVVQLWPSETPLLKACARRPSPTPPSIRATDRGIFEQPWKNLCLPSSFLPSFLCFNPKRNGPVPLCQGVSYTSPYPHSHLVWQFRILACDSTTTPADIFISTLLSSVYVRTPLNSNYSSPQVVICPNPLYTLRTSRPWRKCLEAHTTLVCSSALTIFGRSTFKMERNQNSPRRVPKPFLS